MTIGNKDNAGLTEAQLDEQVRAYFTAQRADVDAPSFAAVMGEAETQLARSDEQVSTAPPSFWFADLLRGPRLTWTGTGAAAAALLAIVFYFNLDGGMSENPEQSSVLAALPAALTITEQQLVADISRTTRWQAPSDEWLAGVASPNLLGFPDLGDPRAAYRIFEEKNLWM